MGNPEVMGFMDGGLRRSASPLPQSSLQKFQDQQMTDDGKSPKTVQWSQQAGAIAKTDFAASTKSTAASSTMMASSKSESQSMSKASFIQESAASFATQSKMEFSSSSSKSSTSSFQVSKK